MKTLYQTLLIAVISTIFWTTLTALPMLAAASTSQLQFPEDAVVDLDTSEGTFFRPTRVFSPFGRYAFAKRKGVPAGTFYAFGGKRDFGGYLKPRSEVRSRNTYFAWGGKRSGSPTMEDMHVNTKLTEQQQRWETVDGRSH